MKKLKYVLILTLLVILLLSSTAYFLLQKHEDAKPIPVGEPTPPPQGTGWINLLDDAHASAWKNVNDDVEIFEIKDQVLHIFGKTISPLRYAGYTQEEFGDFDLHVEFKLAENANSGLFLRSTFNDPVYRGFEIQVLEDFGDTPNKNGCGSVYDVVTPMYNMSRPAGEWNSYDISLKQQELLVYMNGWLVIHADLSKMTTCLGKFKIAYAELPLQGHLMLQDHGGEAWYRNIMIKKHPGKQPQDR